MCSIFIALSLPAEDIADAVFEDFPPPQSEEADEQEWDSEGNYE